MNDGEKEGLVVNTWSRALSAVAAAVFLSACVFASTPRHATEDDVVVRGSGVIRTAPTGEVVISIHSFAHSDSVAGEVDHEFRFWSEAPLPRFDVGFRAASVEYRGDQLTLTIADRQTYYGFVVDGAQNAATAVPGGFGGATFVGYGLNHSNRRGASRIVEGDGSVTIESIFYPDYGDGTGTGSGGSCDSGGVGSTSCTATNSSSGARCSVSCGAGYYACCTKGGMLTTESCTCVKV